jgi:hypothetical protein
MATVLISSFIDCKTSSVNTFASSKVSQTLSTMDGRNWQNRFPAKKKKKKKIGDIPGWKISILFYRALFVLLKKGEFLVQIRS